MKKKMVLAVTMAAMVVGSISIAKAVDSKKQEGVTIPIEESIANKDEVDNKENMELDSENKENNTTEIDNKNKAEIINLGEKNTNTNGIVNTNNSTNKVEDKNEAFVPGLKPTASCELGHVIPIKLLPEDVVYTKYSGDQPIGFTHESGCEDNHENEFVPGLKPTASCELGHVIPIKLLPEDVVYTKYSGDQPIGFTHESGCEDNHENEFVPGLKPTASCELGHVIPIKLLPEDVVYTKYSEDQPIGFTHESGCK